MGTVTGTIYKGGIPWPDVEVYFDIVMVFSDGTLSYPATRLTTETDANGEITAVVLPTPDNGSVQVRLTLPSKETILFWHSTADGDITVEEIILGAGSEEQIDTLQTLLAQYLKLTGGTMTGPLDFSGTDHGGLKFISLTTAQRDALTPAVGMVIYNTTDGELQGYDGAWGSLGGGAAVWGTITGTLSDQTDLQAALDAKATTTALTTHTDLTTEAHGGILPEDADPITVASSRDIAITDRGRILEVTATATLNFPDGLAGNLQCAIISIGGATTITAATTLQYLDGGAQTAASGLTVNTQCTVYHRGANVYLALGDVTPI